MLPAIWFVKQRSARRLPKPLMGDTGGRGVLAFPGDDQLQTSSFQRSASSTPGGYRSGAFVMGPILRAVPSWGPP
jgi:hypothetical protein